MLKTRDILIERRRYLRLRAPIDIYCYIPEKEKVHSATTKNISADGLRFETRDKTISESNIVELKLNIPNAANPIHAKGKVVWKKKVSLEDTAPFDVGIEFTEIEEDNKNTFLKFLCDTIYDIQNLPSGSDGANHANKKKWSGR